MGGLLLLCHACCTDCSNTGTTKAPTIVKRESPQAKDRLDLKAIHVLVVSRAVADDHAKLKAAVKHWGPRVSLDSGLAIPWQMQVAAVVRSSHGFAAPNIFQTGDDVNIEVWDRFVTESLLHVTACKPPCVW